MGSQRAKDRALAHWKKHNIEPLDKRLRKQDKRAAKDKAFTKKSEPLPPYLARLDKQASKEVKFLFKNFPKIIEVAFAGLKFAVLPKRHETEDDRFDFVSDDDHALNLKACFDFGPNGPANAARLRKLTQELFRLAIEQKNKGHWTGINALRADYIRFCNGIRAHLTVRGLFAGGFKAKGFSDAYANKLPLIKGTTIMDVLENVGLARHRWQVELRDESSDEKRVAMVGGQTKAQKVLVTHIDTWNALLDEDILRSEAVAMAVEEKRLKTSTLALRPLAPELCAFGMGGLSMND
ncbi:hypothetical protein ACHAQH_004060 [Verticillium albo-atrum]